MEMQNSIWQSSTNWNIAKGSLNRSISYDTSEDTENLLEAEPLLLTKPNVDDDSSPCEITINFSERHEIHRIYVRSTARVYEIYLSLNQQDNCEYLCTVRCGAVIEEVEEKSDGAASIPDQLVRNASNTSDEDGWVKVKVHNSQEHSTSMKYDGEISCLENQIHYEATAEMSDVDPCLSLTIRLLSIQTKDCVHINEIYIYADPVDSNDTDPPANTVPNYGASAMFATFLPTLMQLSKSSTSQSTCFSEEASVQKQLCNEAIKSRNEKNVIQEAFTSNTPVKKSCPDQEQPEVNYDVDQNNGQVYSRIEKVLNELVIKVDRVESFCSSFGEKLLKPLDLMEKKIYQLEQKFDSLVAENKSSNQCICSSFLDSNKCSPKSKVDPTFENIEPREDADCAVYHVIESEARAGLAIKAPDFLIEEDDCSDSENASTSFIEESCMDETVLKKKGASIDSALASSLAAFLSSANDTPTISHEPVDATNNGPLDEITFQISATEDSIYDSKDATSSPVPLTAVIDGIEFLTETEIDKCNDNLFSVANSEKPSSPFTSEEGSDIIVMSPKTISLCEFSNEGDGELESKQEGEIEIKNDTTDPSKTLPSGSDQFNESTEFISSSGSDLNKDLAPTDVGLDKELKGVLYEVKFTQDENWISGLPLEFLLTDIPDPNLLEASTSGGDGDCVAYEAHGSDTESDIYGSWVS